MEEELLRHYILSTWAARMRGCEFVGPGPISRRGGTCEVTTGGACFVKGKGVDTPIGCIHTPTTPTELQQEAGVAAQANTHGFVTVARVASTAHVA